MKTFPKGELLEATFVSWSQGFLFLMGVVLVIVMPSSLPIRSAATTPSMAAFFPHLFAVLLAIYAMNFGQLQGNPQRPWRLQYGMHVRPHLAHLALQLSLLLLFSLPLWLVFFHLFYLRWTAWLALAYLWLLAQMWGGFGLWLSFKGFADITQFKIKYLFLIAYFSLTLFAPPLNPFFTLQVLVDPNGVISAGAHLGLALAAALVWFALVALGLSRAARRGDGPSTSG